MTSNDNKFLEKKSIVKSPTNESNDRQQDEKKNYTKADSIGKKPVLLSETEVSKGTRSKRFQFRDSPLFKEILIERAKRTQCQCCECCCYEIEDDSKITLTQDNITNKDTESKTNINPVKSKCSKTTMRNRGQTQSR